MPIQPKFADITGNNQGSIIPSTPAPPITTLTPPPPAPTQSTLAQDQIKAGNQGKPGYDILGNPVSKPVESTSPVTPVLPDQTNRDALAQSQQEYQDTAKSVHDTILNIQNGATPLTPGEQAQIAGLHQQFQTLVDSQNAANAQAAGVANIRGYQTGAAEYDANFQTKTIGSIVSAGAAKIADLQTKEASAIAALTQSFHDKDIASVKDAWNLYQDAAKMRQDALQQTIKDTQTAIKDAADAKIAADKVVYDEVTKPIQDIGLNAAKNGASPETLAAIKGAPTVDAAIAAAGTSIQTSTNPDIAQYLFYKQQAAQLGVMPHSFADWQKEQAQIANTQAYNKAYSTAAGSAAGQASATPPMDTPAPTGLGGNSSGGSILAATGLSIAAFNYLTQGTPSMSRMTAGQRLQIMNESQQWLNKNGVDISTFQSQYDAYNAVLQKNIQRANQTKIMAGEVEGSADALLQAIDHKDMSKIKSINILNLLKGEQVNDPTTMKYNFQLKAMGNDLAGYFSAARGATSPELQDQRDAADVISKGLNSGSVTAFKDSIHTNEGKVTGVVNNAVNSTRKQVWELFGVGDKYAGGTSTADALVQQSQDAKIKVNDYLSQNINQLDSITKLYTTPSPAFGGGLPTDEQVAEYLHL